MKTSSVFYLPIVLCILMSAVFKNYAGAQGLDDLSPDSRRYAATQNLPNQQKISLRAPGNIKIDGKATEWGNFQAYNHNTDIFYAIANDDDNLYLAVKATDPDIINKIVGGGVTLAISKSGKRNAQGNVRIGYPLVDIKSPQLMFNLQNPKGTIPDTSVKTANAIMDRNNAILEQRCKWILMSGIPGLDTLSIYNEQGVKAAGAFDQKKTYTFELAVPLKYLGLTVDNAQNFSYNIILNGCKPRDVNISSPPGSSEAYRAGFEAGMQHVNLQLAIKYSPTDFWGEYTLAKK